MFVRLFGVFGGTYHKGLSINYVISVGGDQKLPILHSKKMTKRRGGQKSPILKQHGLWTAPKHTGNLIFEKPNKANVIPRRLLGCHCVLDH